MRALHRRAPLAVAVALALSMDLRAAPALAQAPDAATRKAARILAEEGLSLYDRGEHAAALEKLDKADVLLSAPTVDLYAARCLVKLGRWVEALARYDDVLDAPADPDAPEPFKEAVARARREREALLPKIPRLVVTVRGGRPGAVSVQLDGGPLAPDQLGAERRVDPGAHRVEATSGDHADVEEVTLTEGERAAVELALPEPPPPAPRPAPPPAEVEDPGRAQRTIGGVTLAIGAAGTLLWGVTGALALARNGELTERGCADGRCPYGVDQGSYRGLRVASAVGFWTGLVGLGAGATLLLTAPAAPTEGAPRATTINVWTDPAAPGRARVLVDVRGSF